MEEVKDRIGSAELNAWIRSQFYGIDDGRLFFNNAAGAMRLNTVLDLQRKLTCLPDYPSAGSGADALYLHDAIAGAEARIRMLIDAPETGVIVQDLTASKLLFSLANAACRYIDGTVITTELDHPASIDGVLRAAERYGRKTEIIPVEVETHTIDKDKILDAVRRGAGILMMTCTSNTTGAVLPYIEICREARRINPDIIILLDGVQRVPHGQVRLSECDADALVFAPYKVFSARGSGIAWVSDRMNHLGEECLIGKDGSQWELGSIDPVSLGLMTEVVNYIAGLGEKVYGPGDSITNIRHGQDVMEMREHQILKWMLEGTDTEAGLRALEGAVVCFDMKDSEPKDLILSIRSGKYATKELYDRMLKEDIYTSLRSSTSIYCGSILEHYGYEAVVRISPMHYHTQEDVENFLRKMRTIVQ